MPQWRDWDEIARAIPADPVSGATAGHEPRWNVTGAVAGDRGMIRQTRPERSFGAVLSSAAGSAW